MKTASRPLFVFAGGGSGGHLQPGLAVAAELQRLLPGAEALFLCSAREVDRRILSAAAADNPWLDWAPTAGARGGTGLWRLGEPLRLGRESLRAYRRLRTRRPMVVTGLGARASIAGCVAARLLGVPLVLLEFKVSPGAATRLLRLIATEGLTGLPVGEVSARGLHGP
ncbi:MAG: glycosyltransferase, partial [Planctomyces sp.]